MTLLITELLARVKRILSNPEIDDAILNDFIEMYNRAICLHTGTNQTPIELEFVLIELVIARFNKIGSEGMKSEKVDVVTQTFHDELMDGYMPYINQWKASNQSESTSSLPRIRFL